MREGGQVSELRATLEHVAHVRYIRHVPVLEGGQVSEARTTTEHGAHARDIRHVP